MQITFRWFGESDRIPLKHIKQIPAVTGIVSALYDVKAGDVWPIDKILALKNRIESGGLQFAVIESIPVHEDIKLGLPSRDRLIENYSRSIENMGRAGIKILCYNFMPVSDWTRSNLNMQNPDGSTCLSYDDAEISAIDLRNGTADLPGWAVAYTRDELARLLELYSGVDEEKLWSNLKYFLEAVVPVAEKNGVRMAVHPDDPPWPVFGLPRIVKNSSDLERLIGLVNSPSNGITYCTGSLSPDPEMELEKTLRRMVSLNRVPFVHMRNIKRTGPRSFHETAHITSYGEVDMAAVMKILIEEKFDGAVRPDHGRMIWDENGKSGYGLYDRALGAMYIEGLREGISKTIQAR